MDRDEAQSRMQEIQRIMERATLWTILPGASAILGGLMVLGGCLVSYLMFRSVRGPSFTPIDFAALLDLSLNGQIAFCVMWFLIGAGGVVAEIHFAQLQAKRQGISPKGRSARLAFFSLTPSVVVAMVLTVKFLSPTQMRAQEIQYIAPVWMMLYGTGVYTAGLFSVRAPRTLGMAFIAAGVASIMFLQPYGVITAALSFGWFHIAFGLYVISKRRAGLST
ncbi:MAG: hypothetical protein FJ280_05130 [Planctomycetes bacterium]|nr:hypothetical protein [Planctomycetota bacterium]